MAINFRSNTIIKNLRVGPLSGGGNGGGGYSIPIETSGLQLWWDASQYTSGTTMNDLSGNSRNGTISGTPTFNSLGASSYFTFSNSAPWSSSGQGSYILTSDTSNYFNITEYDGMSISVWVEVPNTSEPNNIYGLGDRVQSVDISLRKYYNGYPYNGGANAWAASAMGGSMGGTSATSNTAAGWKNLTTTVSSGTSWTATLYENGVSKSTVSRNISYQNSWFTTFVLGHQLVHENILPNPEFGFRGNWANAAVYNRELTASEVLSNFNALSSNF